MTDLTIIKNPTDVTSSSINDILKKTNDDIKKYKSVFSISTSFSPENGIMPFKVFDETMLNEINENMKIHDKKRNSFGRKNSQTTSSLMSMQMMNERNPFRLLRQIAAQLEAKRPAVKEWYFKILKERNKIEYYNSQLEKLELKHENLTTKERYKLNQLKILILEKMTNIYDGMIYTEGAIKEIATFQNLYSQICKIHNIPEQWGEKEFEIGELPFHKRRAFVLALRDLQVTGKGNHGTIEYMEQFGINPVQGYKEAENFLKLLRSKDSITEKDRDDWLDRMEEKYKDSHLYVLEKMGIDKLIDEKIQYKENKSNNE